MKQKRKKLLLLTERLIGTEAFESYETTDMSSKKLALNFAGKYGGAAEVSCDDVVIGLLSVDSGILLEALQEKGIDMSVYINTEKTTKNLLFVDIFII